MKDGMDVIGASGRWKDDFGMLEKNSRCRGMEHNGSAGPSMLYNYVLYLMGNSVHYGFRYNIYDRAPLSSMPQEKMQEFYLHFINLSKVIRNPKNEHWLKLEPGNISVMA